MWVLCISFSMTAIRFVRCHSKIMGSSHEVSESSEETWEFETACSVIKDWNPEKRSESWAVGGSGGRGGGGGQAMSFSCDSVAVSGLGIFGCQISKG